MCQVTSNPYADAGAVALTDDDFRVGSLSIRSYVRPGKLFTANRDLLVSRVGDLKAGSLERIVQAVVNILQSHTGT